MEWIMQLGEFRIHDAPLKKVFVVLTKFQKITVDGGLLPHPSSPAVQSHTQSL